MIKAVRGFSIRKKIFFGYLAVILLLSIFVFFLQPMLGQISEISKQVAQNVDALHYLQEMSTSINIAETELDKYFEIGQTESREIISVELTKLINNLAMLGLQTDRQIEQELKSLAAIVYDLQQDLAYIDDLKSSNTRTGMLNEEISKFYLDLSLAKSIHQKIFSTFISSSVVASLEQQDIVSRIYVTVFLVIGIIFLTSALLALIISSALTKSIFSLKNIVNDFQTTGKLDFGDFKPSKDEIGELAGDFKALAEQLTANEEKLRQVNKELEGQVKERTKALEEKLSELEKWQETTTGRELKMIELKNRIEELEYDNALLPADKKRPKI